MVDDRGERRGIFQLDLGQIVHHDAVGRAPDAEILFVVAVGPLGLLERDVRQQVVEDLAIDLEVRGLERPPAARRLAKELEDGLGAPRHDARLGRVAHD